MLVYDVFLAQCLATLCSKKWRSHFQGLTYFETLKAHDQLSWKCTHPLIFSSDLTHGLWVNPHVTTKLHSNLPWFACNSSLLPHVLGLKFISLYRLSVSCVFIQTNSSLFSLILLHCKWPETFLQTPLVCAAHLGWWFCWQFEDPVEYQGLVTSSF